MQDYVNLEIKEKSGLSLNPDIHHLKVPSSGKFIFYTIFQFVKINAAYSVLGNKKQRRMYDLEILMHEDPRLFFLDLVSNKIRYLSFLQFWF